MSRHGGPHTRNDIDTAALLYAALEKHSEQCLRCGGPNDGCELGAGIEHVMLEFDGEAYERHHKEENCEWCDKPVENGKTHGEGKCFDADTGDPLP